MEEVLIMGLVVHHLVFFSINSSFQDGKWVANHIHNSTTLKLPASRETSYTECMCWNKGVSQITY